MGGPAPGGFVLHVSRPYSRKVSAPADTAYYLRLSTSSSSTKSARVFVSACAGDFFEPFAPRFPSPLFILQVHPICALCSHRLCPAYSAPYWQSQLKPSPQDTPVPLRLFSGSLALTSPVSIPPFFLTFLLPPHIPLSVREPSPVLQIPISTPSHLFPAYVASTLST